MSAIGSYAVLRRALFPLCLERARSIRTETTGRWLFRSSLVAGMQAFEAAWKQALVAEVTFGYSGYVLGNYLDAQEALNSVGNSYEESEAATAIAKAFTAGFAFEERVSFPALPKEKLLVWCQGEYGKDAEAIAEALVLAHEFYQQGLERVDRENLVVFIIR